MVLNIVFAGHLKNLVDHIIPVRRRRMVDLVALCAYTAMANSDRNTN